MERIHPDKLSASRVYFTGFDRVTYSQVAWTAADVEEIKRNLERQLKLLAIVKGHVVIAASHLLESELAREVISPYPALFSKHIVVPALRSEFPTCKAFLESKLSSSSPGEASLYAGHEQEAMAETIDGTAMVVEWDVDATSSWFKGRLLSDLRRGNSLLSLTLRRNRLTVPQELYTRIEQIPVLSRGFISELTKDMESLQLREIIGAYTDFLYYLSGARAVNSEGVLPQENIIDFRLGDLSERATPLSENEVFFKIFIDIVKSATSTYFPVDVLDALSIPDAIALHSVASDEHFIEKYNAIQEKTKQGLELEDPERLVLLMGELEEFERQLHVEFARAMEQELPGYALELRAHRVGDFVHAVASLVFTAYGIVAGAKSIVVSGLRLAGRDDIATGIESRIQERLEACDKIASQRSATQRPILLGFVDRLKKSYVRKMFFPAR
jgi:hypothetical protein